MEFGIALAQLRRARGWSQEELAHKAQISQRHVSFLETGRSKPGQAALAKLPRALALKGWEQRTLMRSLTDPLEAPAKSAGHAALPPGFHARLSHWPDCTFQADGSLEQGNAALAARRPSLLPPFGIARTWMKVVTPSFSLPSASPRRGRWRFMPRAMGTGLRQGMQLGGKDRGRTDGSACRRFPRRVGVCGIHFFSRRSFVDPTDTPWGTLACARG